MPIFKEIPPTAGFPFYLKDLLRLFIRRNSSDPLTEDFKQYLGVPYARVTYSGTAALYLILESLKTLSPKRTVVIPAYVCPLVPLAIKRAGLKIALCDIRRDNFAFDPQMLEQIYSANADILAIVPVHLGGIPLNLQRVEELSRSRGVFIVEDCAQSLGGSLNGRRLGTIGDFAFFSLCRGKGLTIYEGGVIATKDDAYGRIIDRKMAELVHADDCSEALKVAQLFGYWLFYRPSLFWFVFRLPQIFWNLRGDSLRAAMEHFDAGFAVHKVSYFRRLMGHLSFWRLEEEIGRQRNKAAYYAKLLKGVAGIRVIGESDGGGAVYPYLTLIFDDPGKKERTLHLLDTCGLGGSLIYCCAVNDYAYLKDIIPSGPCPNARYIAQRALTLSTNIFLKRAGQERVIRIIKGALAAA